MVEVIIKLIEICPLLLHKRDRDSREVIMQSIVNRHENVFNLYYGLEGFYSAQANI